RHAYLLPLSYGKRRRPEDLLVYLPAKPEVNSLSPGIRNDPNANAPAPHVVPGNPDGRFILPLPLPPVAFREPPGGLLQGGEDHHRHRATVPDLPRSPLDPDLVGLPQKLPLLRGVGTEEGAQSPKSLLGSPGLPP